MAKLNLSIEGVKVPTKLAKKAADLLAERVRLRKSSLVRDMRTYSELAKDAADGIDKAEDHVRQEVALWAEAQARLKAARLPVKASYWGLGLTVEDQSTSPNPRSNRKFLLRVHRAVGRLDGSTQCVEVADAEKNLVRVTLKAAKFPDLTVSFLRKLKPTDRCRIEAVTETRHRLVCEKK